MLIFFNTLLIGLLFSHSVLSDSLWPHGLQHARLPFPSLSPRAYTNPCPLSWWCHPTISFSVIPFSSCPQSLSVFSNELALHIRWPKYWGFSFTISPSSEYTGLISFGIDCLISLLSRELSRVFSSTTVQKHQFVGCHSAFFMVQISHLYMTSGKIIALTIWAFVSKAVSLLFNTFSRFVITFFPRNKHLGISYQYLLVNFYNLNFFSLGQCLWTNL